MKYLIFGSGGFLGKKLVQFLRTKNHVVVATQRNDEGDYRVDITSQETFSSLKEINDIDVIINSASVLPNNKKEISDADYLASLFQTNVIGAVNILNFALAKNIKKVINCSTLAVINKPWPVPLTENYVAYPTGVHSGYCVSKLSQELVMNEIAKKLNIELLHLRLSSLYGIDMVWQGVLPLLIEKSVNEEKIYINNAEKVSFDFLLVDDLVRIIYELSILDDIADKTINVASGEEVYLNQLVEDVIYLSGSKSEVELQNNSEQPLSRSVIDTSVLKKILGEKLVVTPFKKGLKGMVEHYKAMKCVI